MYIGHYIFRLSKELKFVECNSFHPEYTEDMVIGAKITEFLVPKYVPVLEAQIKEADKSGNAVRCWQWNSPEGPVCILCTLLPIKHPFAGRQYVCAAHRVSSGPGDPACLFGRTVGFHLPSPEKPQCGHQA